VRFDDEPDRETRLYVLVALASVVTVTVLALLTAFVSQ